MLFFMAPLLGLPVEDAAPCLLENTTDALLLERIVGRKALRVEAAVTVRTQESTVINRPQR